jgi:hypothetical protein
MHRNSINKLSRSILKQTSNLHHHHKSVIQRQQQTRFIASNNKQNLLENMQVTNKNTILSEIDHKLGRTKPPAFEFIYVEPVLTFKLGDRKNSSQNPYGHACIRYTLPGNEQVFMNIVGNPSAKHMCNFLSPEDYLFGAYSQTKDLGSEQGGIYMRSYCGFRIEEYPEDLIVNMHEYYSSIQKKEESKLVQYMMLWFPVMNWGFLSEKGNCSYWTSKGMVEAKIFNNPTAWPKYGFAKLYLQTLMQMNVASHAFYNALSNDVLKSIISNSKTVQQSQQRLETIEEERRKIANNVNIVYYKQFTEEENTSWTGPRGWLRPFSLDHGLFFDLEKFSNAVVQVVPSGDGSYKAEVNLHRPENRPFWPKELL